MCRAIRQKSSKTLRSASYPQIYAIIAISYNESRDAPLDVLLSKSKRPTIVVISQREVQVLVLKKPSTTNRAFKVKMVYKDIVQKFVLGILYRSQPYII